MAKFALVCQPTRGSTLRRVTGLAARGDERVLEE